MGRDTRGVKGITLDPDDWVVGMVVADPEGYLLTICENGYGKRTPFGPNEGPAAAEELDEVDDSETPSTDSEGAETAEGNRSTMRYRVQRRGGKGLRDIKTSERNGPVVAVLAVRDGDEMMLITQQGMLTRIRVDEVRVTGRNTQGVRLIHVQEGDRVVSAAKIAREELAPQDSEASPEQDAPSSGDSSSAAPGEPANPTSEPTDTQE
jgi:DNA gyrase subunit A